MFSPLLYRCLSLQQMQLLTTSQNENRDDHVELNIVDFTCLLIFVSLCMLCFCYSVYCLYLQQMQPEEMSDQQAEQEDHGEGGDF